MSVAGEIAHIINVFELPPNAFCSIRVRHESLYGTTVPFPLPIALSASVLITNPSTDNDLLIPAAYFSLSPVAPVFPTFSLPAKSTRYITDSFSLFLPYNAYLCLNYIDIIVCALDDDAFISVAAIDLFLPPYYIFCSILS